MKLKLQLRVCLMASVIPRCFSTLFLSSVSSCVNWNLWFWNKVCFYHLLSGKTQVVKSCHQNESSASAQRWKCETNKQTDNFHSYQLKVLPIMQELSVKVSRRNCLSCFCSTLVLISDCAMPIFVPKASAVNGMMDKPLCRNCLGSGAVLCKLSSNFFLPAWLFLIAFSGFTNRTSFP